MPLSEIIDRERRNARRIVTNAHLFSESLVKTAFRFLRQHGAA